MMKPYWPLTRSMVLHSVIVYYKYHLRPTNQYLFTLSSPSNIDLFSCFHFFFFSVCVIAPIVCSVRVFLLYPLNKTETLEENQSSYNSFMCICICIQKWRIDIKLTTYTYVLLLLIGNRINMVNYTADYIEILIWILLSTNRKMMMKKDT